MTKVLVTGSEGFIGSHLTEALVRDGYSVKALVQYNSFSSVGWLTDVDHDVKKSLEIVFGDIRDPGFTQDLVGDVTCVLHLAALIAIPYSYVAPQNYVGTNISGTINLLEASKRSGVTRFIHTSTSEVYGSAQYVPIDENHPLVGQSPYSATKIAADQLAYSYYASFGVPVTIVRPFNTYGPRQSSRAVIPTIIRQALFNNGVINIGSLTTRRDFTFVSDTADGFLSALRAPLELVLGQTINLGSGFDVRIEKLVELVGEILNRKLEINIDDERVRPDKSEVDRLLACNKKAEELLDWTPVFQGEDGLKRGLEETISWFEKQLGDDEIPADRYTI